MATVSPTRTTEPGFSFQRWTQKSELGNKISVFVLVRSRCCVPLLLLLVEELLILILLMLLLLLLSKG
jgi:hypothetical protein